MSTSELTTRNDNAEIVRRLFDAYEANDAAQMDALLAAEFTAHGLPPQLGDGPAAMKATAALMHGALADCRCDIDDLSPATTASPSAIRPGRNTSGSSSVPPPVAGL